MFQYKFKNPIRAFFIKFVHADGGAYFVQEVINLLAPFWAEFFAIQSGVKTLQNRGVTFAIGTHIRGRNSVIRGPGIGCLCNALSAYHCGEVNASLMEIGGVEISQTP